MNQIKSKSLKKFIPKFYSKISYKIWILPLVAHLKEWKLRCLFLYYFGISASKL